MARARCRRRLKYGEISSAWSAWVELAGSRVYALKRLREIGNRLRTPEIAVVWSSWYEQLREDRRRAQSAPHGAPTRAQRAVLAGAQRAGTAVACAAAPLIVLPRGLHRGGVERARSARRA